MCRVKLEMQFILYQATALLLLSQCHKAQCSLCSKSFRQWSGAWPRTAL